MVLMAWRRAAPLWRQPVALLRTRRHIATSRRVGASIVSAVSTGNDENGRQCGKTTPMVQQYLARKREYPDCMLLFQVGDFYEFFGDDARRASHLLNLALTKKSKQSSEFEEMCGFPLGSVDSYVEKLVMHHGVKVAICNQVESAAIARKRGYKALVDRQVVRIVTPGSLVEDTMLTPEENNYLAALFPASSGSWGLAWADLSTGEFVSTTATADKLAGSLLRCSPKEILLPASLNSEHGETSPNEEILRVVEAALPESCMRTFRPDESFASASLGGTRDARDRSTELEPVEEAAVAAIVDYARFTQRNTTALVGSPLHVESSDHMIIDSSAWRSLEIAKSLSGYKASSLLHSIDSTITPGGSRLLAAQLASPLMNLRLLEKRLNAVSYFVEHDRMLRKSRKQLADVFDMERSLQRLSIGVATPKDLKNVAATIDEAKKLAELITSHHAALQKRLPGLVLPEMIESCCTSLDGADTDRERATLLADEIHAALKDDYTALNSKMGFVRSGYSAELDKWQSVLAFDPHSPQKAALQAKYRELMGSTRLRVVFQAEKGYFIEMPHEENSKLLRTEQGKRELERMSIFQSLKNTVRYRSDELRTLNRELMEANQEVERIEAEIFDHLKEEVLALLPCLQATAHAISQLDVVCSHAQVALDRNFTRPILDASHELHIEDGRHVVVEAAHLKGVNSRGLQRSFVPNSLHCGPALGSSWLLTGPNMGGKSTFLRQNAHLVVLAQMGSFVPARFARVGLVDKLFCRVGSADDLASDKSTFMVEMQETATILMQATSRSLVLMDEVGRGTSVNDGVAIATAVLEALSARQVRTLFATHFTALKRLIAPAYQKDLQFYRMEVLERHSPAADTAGPALIFSHRVVRGLADQSYGINTAALAGCPPDVVRRATEVLRRVSGGESLKHESAGGENRRVVAADSQLQLQQIAALLSDAQSDGGHARADADNVVEKLRQILDGNAGIEDSESSR